MYNEVTEEDIEAAAAIDWSEVFKDSLTEPFDIKTSQGCPEDVELIERPSTRQKPKQRRKRGRIDTRWNQKSHGQKKIQRAATHAEPVQLLFPFVADFN